MIKTKKTFWIFLPAILIASLALFIRFIQYEPAVSEDNFNQNSLLNNQQIQIPIYPEDPILGDKKSADTLIVFEDFGCEACNQQSMLLEKIQTNYPKKIKIIWKGLPVTQFPEPTNLAHKYAYCLNKQKTFLEFSKLAFNNGKNLTEKNLQTIASGLDINQNKLKDCLAGNEVLEYTQKNELLAKALNIQAVPAMFLNNKQITPPADFEGWVAVLGF